jgi:hypothetical protein
LLHTQLLAAKKPGHVVNYITNTRPPGENYPYPEEKVENLINVL